jgi:lipoic acid synthetase
MNRSKRLPPWIRTKFPAASALAELRTRTYAKGLATVCREARCPNQGDCSQRGTATFLILGDRCTRNCSFCAVRHGVPRPVNPDEPHLVAESVAALGLKHAVITSVTRDDLPDGGASAFAATVLAIRRRSPGITVEVLVPDFKGCPQAVQAVLDVRPDVFNHNLETVPRLYPTVRAGASYRRSIELLELVAQADRGIVTKSGIMLGVGETFSEVVGLIRDLAQIGVMVLTMGQYLQPSSAHHPVHRYVPPEEFERLRDLALAEGIGWVESGPLVRSSYHAETIMADLKRKRAFGNSINLIAERSEIG